MMQPRFPIYIPSKSRAARTLTPRALRRMSVPYRIVVEEHQHADYARHHDPATLLVLDPEYQRVYEVCDEFGDTKPKGSGPARNFIWDHAIGEGHDWHWVIDDNITQWLRLHQNTRIKYGDGTPLYAMEDFTLRYSNIAMAGPHYAAFAPSRQPRPPFETGTRVYSCNLIRSDLPFRWRGRYNEDTILSLDMLKAGWATVLFYAFLQEKMVTQSVKGGNTDMYRVDGTLPKSQMLVREHPDVARLVWRYERWHHYVDYSRWRGMNLVRRDDYEAATEYRLAKVVRK